MIQNLYFYPDMAMVKPLDFWEDLYGIDNYFNEWKSKNLININNLDIYNIQEYKKCLINAVEGCYRIIINNNQIINLFYIPFWVFNKLSIDFPYIYNKWYLDFSIVLILLKLIHGYSIPEIGYNGNIRKEGKIIKIL